MNENANKGVSISCFITIIPHVTLSTTFVRNLNSSKTEFHLEIFTLEGTI